MKFDTPGWFSIVAVAMSPRKEANGVKTWPNGSVRVRFQVNSADMREYSPGIPRSRQLAGVIAIGLAVVGRHRLLLIALLLIASNSADWRLRFVTFALYDSSPPRTGCPKV